ncbi:MAG TPA: flagellar FliJ family protein [Gammaproteobacteria bacterium]|nr:flagellar FliJ family protein [Gammaproteobacteria bacterium]
MSKPTRLEPIAEIATMRENEAAQRLAASSAQLTAKEKELEQLRGYLAEYRQRALAESTDSARLQNTRAFLTRLSDAVAFHEAELQKAVDRHRVELEHWRDSHQRAQALDKYIERSQRQELDALQRRDQAEVDERAARHGTRG